MKVKLLKIWNGNDIGAVLDLDPPVASLLIGREVAEEVVEPAPAKRIDAPPADKMMRSRNVRNK